MSAFVLIVCYIKNLSQMKAIRFQAQSIMLWELSHLHYNETCLNYWSISIHTLTIDSQKMLQSERAFVRSYFISCEDIPEAICSQKLYLWCDRMLITMHNNKWRLQMEVDARTATNCHQHWLFISWSSVTEWTVCHVWYWWRTVVSNKNSNEQPGYQYVLMIK